MPARDSTYFYDNPSFQEASRFIELDLHVTNVGDLTAARVAKSPDDASLPNAHELMLSRPTIHFAGISRGGNGNEAKVRGYVKMTNDGNIRWKFVSVRSSFYHVNMTAGVEQVNTVSSTAVHSTLHTSIFLFQPSH